MTEAAPPPPSPTPATPPPSSGGSRAHGDDSARRNGGGSGRGRGHAGRGRGFASPASERLRHEAYLDEAAVSSGLRDGTLFASVLRVSARQRSTAYATLPGLPTDVLIEGFSAQNRAVEGDTVVLRLQPPETWPLLDGGGGGGGDASPLSPLATAARDAELDADDTSDAEFDESTLVARIPLSGLSLHGGDAPPPPAPPAPSPESPHLRRLADAAVGPPPRRPVGRVVAVASPSPRRSAIVGYLTPPPPPPPSGASPAAQAKAQQHQSRSSGSGGRGGGGRGGGHAPPPPLPPPPRDVDTWAFAPADPRLPRMDIPGCRVPQCAVDARSAGTLGQLLLLGTLTSWQPQAACPTGDVSPAALGFAGDVTAETAAIVAEHNLRDVPFSDAVLACLPDEPDAGAPWRIPADELASRRDFRNDCVFSIDPPSARDLDDALSCSRCVGPHGGWVVGVHIADVSHFVAPGCALDAEAAARATSTYLVQRVIPMLPRLLCEQLCSLNPGVERLTFSVVWELSDTGEVRTEWLGRGVIRSSAKLDYATAQAVIDAYSSASSSPFSSASPQQRASPDVLAAACSAPLLAPGAPPVAVGHSPSDVAASIVALHTLAQALRAARTAGGALRLDNAKLWFALDKNGFPTSASPYVTGQSHQLVEEFMLLANRRVASFIASSDAPAALLRRHPPPDARKLASLATLSDKHGLGLVTTSGAGPLHASLIALRASKPHLAPLATVLATKPQQLASYFCAGQAPSKEQWRHYALAMDEYTHFTSPIRRYADLLVHRALAAALGQPPPAPLLRGDALSAAASVCNERKMAAKLAQEASGQLFLCLLLRAQPRAATASVLATGRRFLTVYLDNYGFETQVSLEGDSGIVATGDTGGTILITRSTAGRQQQPPLAPHLAVAAAKLPLRVPLLGQVPVLLAAAFPDGRRCEVVASLLVRD